MGFKRDPSPRAYDIRKIGIFWYCIDHSFKDSEASVFECFLCWSHCFDRLIVIRVEDAKVGRKNRVVCIHQGASGMSRTVQVLIHANVIKFKRGAVEMVGTR